MRSEPAVHKPGLVHSTERGHVKIAECFGLRRKCLYILIASMLPGAAVRAVAQQDPPQPQPQHDKQTNIGLPTAPGNTEVGGFIGGSYGLDSWRVMGGGNVAYALTRYIMPYGEFSYLPGISRQISNSNGNVNYDVRLIDFHGGVHIRFPLGQSKTVPYAVAGAGIIHSGKTPITVAFPDGFTVSDTIAASTDFAVNFGAGLRYYATERLGFRVEGKVYKPTGTYTTPFYKIEVGVFFQFR